MSRACSYPRRTKRDEEAHGRKEGTMSALLNEEDDVKKRIDTLKEELREAEMKLAVGDTSIVMHTMLSDSPGEDNQLGPSVFAEI